MKHEPQRDARYALRVLAALPGFVVMIVTAAVVAELLRPWLLAGLDVVTTWWWLPVVLLAAFLVAISIVLVRSGQRR